MDVFTLLLTGLELLGLGMAFVFLFLGLLMIAVNLIAKYLPADPPVPEKKTAQARPVIPLSETSAINPKIITAITAAVHQYHKTKTAQ
ncbi:OadG family transporter subunit [Psychromonas sp.]|uniref:OadG family transporter subunit n=1 Tax=Psychromonas sp. TaxID=1884585 RepID=UPI00356AEC1B